LIFLERFSYFGAERREISLFLAINRENRAQCLRMWSASRAADIVKPPVFASSNGVLDLLMIAQPGVVKGFTVPGFIPTGWFYTVCRRPAKGDSCPNNSGTVSSYGGVRLALQPGDELKIRLVNARHAAVVGRAHPRRSAACPEPDRFAYPRTDRSGFAQHHGADRASRLWRLRPHRAFQLQRRRSSDRSCRIRSRRVQPAARSL